MKGAGALRELSSEISEIKNCATDLIAREQVIKPPETIAEAASSSHPYWGDDSFVHLPGDDEMVGFEKHKVKLIDQLISEESNSHMDIAIVGPGGFGKSTLVRNVFVDKRVKRHFECSAWVSITQNFDKKELVDDIILQFQDEKKRWQYLRVGEPVSVSFATGDKRSYVRNYLQRKRYIVVLDDVFNQEDLQFIESFLPKNGVGSRIIITTHKHDLAFSHDGSPRRIHDLSRGLPLDAAWNLFCKKAFRASCGKCPQELESIAQRILSNCGGSPFAVVAVSRMLAMKPQLPVEWEAFHDSLGSEIGTDPKWIVSRTLLRSYNDLSSTLKSCFVYLSIFPKNYHIERGRLIRLWLAEGFVKHTNRKALERVADDYLDELIARNLIHVTERDFSGRVSTCEVKNLVHEFLINMSDEENFVTIYSVEDSEIINSQPRRVSIHAATFNPSKSSSMILSSVRSSFMFAQQIEDFQSKIQKFISQFMLLKVLDLQGSSLEDFPEEICGLTLLRYLSLRDTKIKTIPKSIKKLVYIETLDLKQTQVRKLPNQILRLPNLRYLLVYLYDVENYVTFDSAKGVEIYPEVRFLSKLLKLTLIKANDQKIFAELGYLKKLRKLGLIDLKTEDGESCVLQFRR
uniref:NB-ARC domain-containing protein n=1 Tax=Kalanchoe fedtschenkoi TaxID=63787 RepID=A0A7N0VH49_KALFE